MAGCLVALLVGFFIIIVTLLMSVAKFLFGVRNAARQFMGGTGSNSRNSSAGSSSTSPEEPPKEEKKTARKGKNGKFFGKDEGEYIDFEDIRN